MYKNNPGVARSTKLDSKNPGPKLVVIGPVRPLQRILSYPTELII